MPYEITTEQDEWGNTTSINKTFVPAPSRAKAGKETLPKGNPGISDATSLFQGMRDEVAERYKDKNYFNPVTNDYEKVPYDTNIYEKYNADIKQANETQKQAAKEMADQNRQLFNSRFANARKIAETKGLSFNQALMDKDIINEMNLFKQETGGNITSQNDVNRLNLALTNFTSAGGIPEIGKLISGDTKHAEAINNFIVKNIETNAPVGSIFTDYETGEKYFVNALGEQIIINKNTMSTLDAILGSFSLNSDLMAYGLLGSMPAIGLEVISGLGKQGVKQAGKKSPLANELIDKVDSKVQQFGSKAVKKAAEYGGFAGGNYFGGASDLEKALPEIMYRMNIITNGKASELSNKDKLASIDAANVMLSLNSAWTDGIDPEAFISAIQNNPDELKRIYAAKEMVDGAVFQAVIDGGIKVIKSGINAGKAITPRLPGADKVTSAKDKVIDVASKLTDKLPDDKKALVSAGLNKVQGGVNRVKAGTKAAATGGLTHAVVGFGGSVIDPTGGLISHAAGIFLGYKAGKSVYNNNMILYNAAQEAKQLGMSSKTSNFALDPHKFIEDFLGNSYSDKAYLTDIQANLARYGITLKGSLLENKAAIALLNSPNSAEYIKVLAKEFPQTSVNLSNKLRVINDVIKKDIEHILPKNKNIAVENIIRDIQLQFNNNLNTLEALGELMNKGNLKVSNPSELLQIYNKSIKGLNKGKQLTELQLPTNLVSSSKANATNKASPNIAIKGGSSNEAELKLLLDDAQLTPADLITMKANLDTISDIELKNSPLLANSKIAIDLAIKDMLKEAPQDIQIAYESFYPSIVKNLKSYEALGYNKVFKQLVKDPSPSKVASKLIELAETSKSIEGTNALLELTATMSPGIKTQVEGLLLSKIIDNAIDESASVAKNFINVSKALKTLKKVNLQSAEAKAIKELLEDYNSVIKDPVALMKNLSANKTPELGSGIGTSLTNRIHVMLTTRAIKTLKQLFMPTYNSNQYRLVKLASKALMYPMDAEARNNLNNVYKSLIAKQHKTLEDANTIRQIQEVNNYLEKISQDLFNGTIDTTTTKQLDSRQFATSNNLENITNLKASQLLVVNPADISKHVDTMLDEVTAYTNKIKGLLEQQGTYIDELSTANSIIDKFNASIPQMYKTNKLPRFTEESYFERLPEVIEKVEQATATQLTKVEEQEAEKSLLKAVADSGPVKGAAGGAVVGGAATPAMADDFDSQGKSNAELLGQAAGIGAIGFGLLGALKKPPKLQPLLNKVNKLTTPKVAEKPMEKQVNKIFAGENAKLTKENEFNLEVAKGLHKKGVDADTIWKETLWYQDTEDKWRFVIPNKDKVITKQLHKPDITTTLGEVYKFEGLYKAYPQLKDVKIKTFTVKDSEGNFIYDGAFADTKNNIIYVNSHSIDFKRDLRHEVQHIVQTIEGVSNGASPAALSRGLTELLNEGTKEEIQDAIENILHKIKPSDIKYTDITLGLNDPNKLMELLKNKLDYIGATNLGKQLARDKELFEDLGLVLYRMDKGEFEATLNEKIADSFTKMMEPKLFGKQELPPIPTEWGNVVGKNIKDMMITDFHNGKSEHFIGKLGAKNLQGDYSKSLKEAYQLFTDGKTNQQVWKKTNWFIDNTGNWHFWIDPMEAKDSLIPAKQAKNMVDLGEKYRTDTYKGIYALENLYNNPILYKAYPSFKQMKVSFTTLHPKYSNALGLYNPTTNSIELNVNKLNHLDDTLTTVRHEVQHAIDDIEMRQYTSVINNLITTLRDSDKIPADIIDTMKKLIKPLEMYSMDLEVENIATKLLPLNDKEFINEMQKAMENKAFKESFIEQEYYSFVGEIRAGLSEHSQVNNRGKFPMEWRGKEDMKLIDFAKNHSFFGYTEKTKPNKIEDLWFNKGIPDENIKRKIVRIDADDKAPISTQFNLDSKNLEEIYNDIVSARLDPVRWVFENDKGFLVVNKPKKARSGDAVAYYVDKKTKKQVFTQPFRKIQSTKSWNESTAELFARWIDELDINNVK